MGTLTSDHRPPREDGPAQAGSGAEVRLQALAAAVRALAEPGPSPEVLHRALRELAPALPADRCSVLVGHGPEKGCVVVATSDVPGFRQPVDLARYPEVRQALQTLRPVLVRDALADPLLEPVRAQVAAAGARSILVVPFAPAGALFCRLKGRPDAFDAQAQLVAGSLARLIGCTLDAARRQEERERAAATLAERLEGQARELSASLRRQQDVCTCKDEAVSVFAHDVRGPLNILWGHARLLSDAGLDEAEEGSVEAILRQAKKILDLSQAMVERSRAEASPPALVPAPLDLAAACREVAAECEIVGAERGVSVSVKAPPALSVLADGVQVRQVVLGLVIAALGRARQGGDVRVELETLAGGEGELARLTVTDDGPTPDPKEMLSLFERFRRGGPGLFACRDVVELHGGEAWARAASAEGGLSVGFTLPGVGARLPGGALHPVQPEKQLVLVVEDEPALAEIVAEILSGRYRVETAGDGAEAIAKAHALHPALVLMDVFLPRVDGLDATAALKAAPDTHDIPVILVSAHRGVAEKARALHLGAVDFLAKPYEARTLLARIAAVLPPPAAEAKAGEVAARPVPVPGLDLTTGLLDADAFLRRFMQEASRARRYRRRLGLVVLSPRGPVSAAALGPAAAGLGSSLREGDLVGHLGAGRFAVCLAGADAPTSAKVGRRLGASLGAALGVEVGVGQADGLAGTPEEALASASRAAGA